MASSEQRTLEIKAKLYDQLTRPLTGIEKTLQRFQRSSVSAFKGVVSAVFSLKSSVLGLVAAYASLRGVQIVRSLADQTDKLNKLAQSTGDTVENLSELAAAFRLGGVDASQFEALLRVLQKAQRDALEPGNDLAEAFKQIGVNLDELGGLSPSQLFERMAEGLGTFENAAERAAVLSKLLPKQFLQALPTLGRGLEEFQSTILQVRELGATITLRRQRLRTASTTPS